MSPAKLLVLLVGASLSSAAIHHHPYRPEPDFTPLISFYPPSASSQKGLSGLSPGLSLSHPNLNNFNYLYGSNVQQPSSNYYTTTTQSLYPQFPQQQHQPSFSPTPTILSSVSNSPPTYSYSGGLGNLGSLSLAPPILNNYGTYSFFPPNAYQSYLFDPFQPHQQQQQQSHHSKPLSPPFGFIEKQHRNPYDNPADFVRQAPPKAVMTTATEFLGLSDHDSSDSREHQQRRKPTTMSFNHFYNMENTDFDFKYHGNQQKWGSRGNKKGLVTQLKVLNGSEIEVESKRKQNNYVSEPILPPSILSLSNKWDDKDYDNFVKMEQPRNIVRVKRLRTTPGEDNAEQEFEQEDEVQLDVDKLMDEASVDDTKRSYHCPRSTGNDLDDGSNPEVYADPGRCDQFYYCKLGKPYVFKCPVNRYFNPYLKACEVDSDFACAMSLKK